MRHRQWSSGSPGDSGGLCTAHVFLTSSSTASYFSRPGGDGDALLYFPTSTDHGKSNTFLVTLVARRGSSQLGGWGGSLCGNQGSWPVLTSHRRPFQPQSLSQL